MNKTKKTSPSLYTTLSLIFVIVFFESSLLPFNVQLLNDAHDILLSKKICLRCNIDDQEQGIYKDSIRFSVDEPSLSLKSWNTSVEPVTNFVALFKKNKKIFIDSFNVEIITDYSDDEAAKKNGNLLNGSCLYVACMVLLKDGSNKLFNKHVFLGPDGAYKDASLDCKDTKYSLKKRSFTNITKQDKQLHGKALDQDVALLRSLEATWETIKKTLSRVIPRWNFKIMYNWLALLFVFILFLRLGARWFLPSRIPVEVVSEAACILFFILGSFFYSTSWIGPVHESVICAVRSFFLSIGSLYCIITGSEESFWGRLKLLVGFMAACAVLPLLVCAWLQKIGFL